MLLPKNQFLWLLLGDALCLNLSFFWVTLLRRWSDMSGPVFLNHVILFTALTLFWLWIFSIFGLYETKNIQSEQEGLLTTAILTASLLSSLGFYLIQGVIDFPAPKIILLLSSVMAWAMMKFWRPVFAKTFFKNPSQDSAGILVLDQKLLANSEADGYHDALRAAALSGTSVFTNVSYQSHQSGKVPLDEITSLWIIERVLTPSHSHLIYRALKRCFDVAVSLALLLLSAPLIPLVSLWIGAALGAPVLFRQKRLGQSGKIFWIWKFRTMKDKGLELPALTAPNDPRVPPSLRWLRKAHLDELPQLINILKGDMSLVGPRPEQPDMAQGLEQTLPFFWARHTAPPGLTGWAQVNMGYAGTPQDAKERFEYDLYYLANRNLWLDSSILIRTLRNVLTADGR